MIRHFATQSNYKRLTFETVELWKNLASPFCGILGNLFIYARQFYDPKGIVIGGQLNQVASFRGLKESINYHIGGMGMMREEAMLKCLAESYERYVPVMYDVEKTFPIYFGSYTSLYENFNNDIILPPATFNYFLPAQYQEPDFFTAFNAQTKLSWSRVPEITNGLKTYERTNKAIWIPTQLLFFSYLPKIHLGEQRINNVVSTGTAVHKNYAKCILNSLLEIIQIDAAIGHWYTAYPSFRIELTARSAHIQKIIRKSIPYKNTVIEFYWIPQKEFSTFTIICLGKTDTVPYFSLGLGSDVSLECAMYKAFLEFIGTRLLGQSLAVLEEEKKITTDHIQNLDDNVLFYATQKKNYRLESKFNAASSLKDTELPPDIEVSPAQLVKLLIDQFATTDKNLIGINFANDESKTLGLVVTKLWSPQLITVPLPSAVPKNHSRFLFYGGLTHSEPHPYA